MRKFYLCLFFVIASLNPTLGQDWVAEGDSLSRWGSFKQADAAYAKAESSALPEIELRQLLFRRLSLAQTVGDERGAKQIMARLDVLPQTQETKIRQASARADFAYWAGRYGLADQEFDRVISLTSNNSEPYAIIARFAAESFKYKQKVDQEGWPPPVALGQEVQRIMAPLGKLPKTGLYEPLLLTRVHPWVELWIKDNLKRIQANPETSKQDLTNLSFIVGLVQLSLGDRFSKLKDPEAGGLALQYPLDMAEGLADFNTAEANNWLKQVEFILNFGRKQIEQANLGPELSSTGLNFFEARHHAVRGKVRLKQGQISSGLTDLKTATLKLKDSGLSSSRLWALINYAQALQTYDGEARKQEALAVIQEAQAVNRELNLKRAEIILVLLQAGLKPKGSQAAADLCWKAVELLEAESPYLSQSEQDSELISATYDPLITYLAQQNQTEKALDLEARRTSLRQVSQRKIGEIDARDPQVKAALFKAASTQEKARELQSQLQAADLMERPDERAKLEREIADNRGEFLKALNNISQADPEYASLVAIRPTNFARLQTHLPPDALLLQYCQTDTQLLIFTASSTELSIKTVELTRQQLTKKVNSARSALLRINGSTDALEALYSSVISPVEAQIDKASVLIIAPTEGLYHIPFAALITDKDGEKKYLIENKALVTVASTEMLMSGADKKDFEGVVILGDPDGTLPAARQEASEIGSLFTAPKIFLADEAKAIHIRNLAPNTSLVHLATHAITNPQDVNSSYLVMAGTGKETKLTLGEIYGLNFQGVSLVTLSACETAVGQSEPTWSVASLAQAFHLAGAGTLVASLWNVSDEATRELMLSFYGNLKKGSSKAEAMRAAQVSLLKNRRYAHPFFWSGFTIIGDWR